MRRICQSLMLIVVLIVALCICEAAEVPAKAGMHSVATITGVTLTPQTTGGEEVTHEAQGGYSEYYADAVRFDVKATGLTSGKEYVLLVVKGTKVLPTEANIVYTDQRTANASGEVEFNAYPGSLSKADYSIYLVGEGKDFVQNTPDATFGYWQAESSGGSGHSSSSGSKGGNDTTVNTDNNGNSVTEGDSKGETVVNSFGDVSEKDYYYKAVAWAAQKGITKGTDGTHFSPGNICNRAEIVTFLWRAAGSPEPKMSDINFGDVKKDAYYADAVLWAVENGITNGTSVAAFEPNATCTRAQAVTFLARALKAKVADAAKFSDVPENSYFAEAVAWAASSGVTDGVGDNRFAPDSDCTRAQIVTFLWRAYETKGVI